MNLRQNKYGNKYTIVDNIHFSSKREAARYRDLKLLEKGGEIKDLKLQVPFVLQNSFVDKEKHIQRKITYIADFTYLDKTGELIVEDVKSSLTFKTEVYRIKKKLFLYKYSHVTFIESY